MNRIAAVMLCQSVQVLAAAGPELRKLNQLQHSCRVTSQTQAVRQRLTATGLHAYCKTTTNNKEICPGETQASTWQPQGTMWFLQMQADWWRLNKHQRFNHALGNAWQHHKQAKVDAVCAPCSEPGGGPPSCTVDASMQDAGAAAKPKARLYHVRHHQLADSLSCSEGLSYRHMMCNLCGTQQ